MLVIKGGATRDDQADLRDEQAGAINKGICAKTAGNKRRLPRSIPGRRSTRVVHFPFFFLVLPVCSQSRGHHVVELPGADQLN
jgi:hypothetical protein